MKDKLKITTNPSSGIDIQQVLDRLDTPCNVGTVGHIDHGGRPLTELIRDAVNAVERFNGACNLLDLEEDSCKGNFDKKVVSGHTYPFWYKGNKF